MNLPKSDDAEWGKKQKKKKKKKIPKKKKGKKRGRPAKGKKGKKKRKFLFCKHYQKHLYSQFLIVFLHEDLFQK